MTAIVQVDRLAMAIGTRFGLVAAALAFGLVTAPAYALDYDRNDVLGREVAVGFGLSPADINPAASMCLDGKTNTPRDKCPEASWRENEVLPIVLFVRGTARRQTRFFYVAGETQVGLTFPSAGFNAGPWLALGGAVGVETVDDAWQRLRGYGEFGTQLTYTNTRLADMLSFSVEGGMRYQLQSFERPHTLVHIGLRVLSNFRHIGYALQAGIGWTFD